MNIKKIFEALTSKLVYKAVVGGGVGSIIKIELETNIYFFVYCIWRLEHDEIVLSTSDDDSTAVIGLMAMTIKQLEGNRIIRTELSSQLDLTLYFENNYILKLFCNMSYTSGDYSNWELCDPDNNIVFTVNNKFKMETTAYY